VRGLGSGLVLLLLVGATPGCLLYTDRINHSPEVSVSWPAHVYARMSVLVPATATDPDGEAVSLSWSRVDRPCPQASASDWSNAGSAPGRSYQLEVPDRRPFCVKVVARDEAGAEAVVLLDGAPEDRAPDVRIGTAALAGSLYSLWSEVTLSASGSVDQDGDALAFSWDVRDAAGTAVATRKCGPGAQPDVATCFTADHSGTFRALVTGSEGEGGLSGQAELSFTVAEDQPPCLVTTVPSLDTAELVMAVTDSPRRFEVRQVRDDGDPWPPGPHGQSEFRWYIGREHGEWTRQLGFEGPSFEVSAARFPDARPGNVYRVRVEARDAAHDNPAGLRDLDDCDDTRRICERPAGCSRLAWWSVRLQ
jgi:hypothetical protein